MAVFRKRRNDNKDKKLTVIDIVKNPDATGVATSGQIRKAQSIINQELAELSNNLDLPKKIINLQSSSIDLRIIANLAAQGHTEKMISQLLGMSDRNFRYLKKAHPEIEEAILKGQSVLSGRLVSIALSKIEEEKDIGNKLLITLMNEFAGIGGKSQIKIEHSVIEDEDKDKDKEKERQRNIMSKVFDKEKVDEIIDAEFTEVKNKG